MSSTCNLSDFESVLIGTTTNLLIDPGLDAIGSHSLGGGTHFSHLNHDSNTIPDVTPHLNGNQLDMDMNMHISNDVADMPPNTVIDGVELPGHFYGGVDTSAKGLIGHDFEDYLSKTIGGEGSFSVGGRDFDGGIGNRWWEAKSGNYWSMLEENPNKLAKFKSDMGDRLKIATENGATYEIFSNTQIPESIKQWLTKKGITFTELLD